MTAMMWPAPTGQPTVPLPPPWPAPRRFPEAKGRDPAEPARGIPGVVGSPWQWDTTPVRPPRLTAWAQSQPSGRARSGRGVWLLFAAVCAALLLGGAVVLG